MAAAKAGSSRLVLPSVIALTAIALLLASRTFKVPVARIAATASLAGLDSLTPYLAPIGTDTVHAAVLGGDTNIRVPDPFVSPIRQNVTAAAPEIQTPEQAPDSTVVVNGTFISGSRRSAFINETWVRLGDICAGGMRLTSVEKNYVVLTDTRGRRHTIVVLSGGTR
ncbi:MAG TPA: hypothetical protein VMH39_16190 [Gemmatimonadaceae bacterium]|nr:hypothetical protein [Gemmatimonadaceae bacterium]